MPATNNNASVLRLALPKGRMEDGIMTLLANAGIHVGVSARDYRPTISIIGFETKILKPRNAVEMLAAGSRDLGFAGADWVEELGVELVELLDTGLDPVRLIAAAPRELLAPNGLRRNGLRVATEYTNITRRWLARTGIDARIVPSYGATEVFPPEDADFIIDSTATGATLAANKLEIFDDLATSSTRLFASPRCLEDPALRTRIDEFVMLLSSVLAARQRVILEVNIATTHLDGLLGALPAMREPTIAQLGGGAGYAVKAAVPRTEIATLIPELKRHGGTDIIVTNISQIVV